MVDATDTKAIYYPIGLLSVCLL